MLRNRPVSRAVLLALAVILVLTAPVLAAEEGPTPASNALAINTVWTLLAGFLVFLMHAGFTMVETGFTRSKNSVNIIMKNLLTISLGVVIFFMVGFAFMFGDDVAGLIGSRGFWLTNIEGMDFGVPILAFWFFQAVFCATAATIVSGAMAERTKFISYLVFTVVITAVIYPIVGHWIWGGGWLAQRGFIDFAGSTVVHSVGGWAALVGATLLGARIGKYTRDGKVNAIPGHNIPLGALGVLLLWFGWFGFNPGSTLAGTNLHIAHIATTTVLAGAAATITSMVVTWIRYSRPDVGLTLNGALAGLVAITAGTAAVSPTGALIIGAIAGILLVFVVEFFDKVVRVDDPVGAISVHGACGLYGTLMVGFFATEGGLFYGGGTSLLAVQVTGIVAVFVFTVVVAFVTFKVIDALFGLRVSQQEELAGLDIGEHGSMAYCDLVCDATTGSGGSAAFTHGAARSFE